MTRGTSRDLSGILQRKALHRGREFASDFGAQVRQIPLSFGDHFTRHLEGIMAEIFMASEVQLVSSSFVDQVASHVDVVVRMAPLVRRRRPRAPSAAGA